MDATPRMLDPHPGARLRAVLRAEIEDAIQAGIGAQMAELRRFVDRRFAELSTEVHASASMAEMTEATLAEQISKVQCEVARMVSMPRTETATSGLELEGVVQTTEAAANQILEAAETIADWASKVANSEAASEINHQVQSIFEACSFQDLTSQRVRRAIKHLEQVDIMLNNIVAAEQMEAQPVGEGNFGGTGKDLAQSMIDRLMDF